MKEFFTKLWKRYAKGQNGFTLAELIVVVAIIVGLAAVILPNVGRFTSRGEQGALATERNSVQTALDTYAADWAVDFPGQGLPNNATGVPSNFGEASPTIDLIGEGYLRLGAGRTETAQYFCWTNQGTISTYSTDQADINPCPANPS